MDVAIVGGGSWGTTLAHVAATNGHGVKLLLRDSVVAEAINRHRENPKYLPGHKLAPMKATTNWEEGLEGVSLVIIAVPSSVMDKVAKQVVEHISKRIPIISATKGLDKPGLTTMTEVIKRYHRGPVGAIGGPNLSMEILQGQPTASVVASTDENVIKAAIGLWSNRMYRIYGSFDVVGVQLGGALKNIYAIGAGIAEGLGFGLNAKAFFLTRALAEIERLGKRLGGSPLTFRGLAGMGDLIATANSMLSRNFRLGMMLANNTPLKEAIAALGQVAEGATTVATVHDFITKWHIDMPQAEGIYRVLYQNDDPMDVVRSLMSRKKIFEEY